MENIEQINELLLKVKSISQVERELGYGKDTLRKKLNRHGYAFNKITKQYEPVEAQGVKQVKETPKKAVAQVVTGSYMPKECEPAKTFNEGQLEILHRMIKEYELKEHIRISSEDKGELTNRNVRVYVEHFNQFSNWCKSQGITQADALYAAINLLIEKYD